MSILNTYKSVATEALCTLTGIYPINIDLKYDYKASQIYTREIAYAINNILLDFSQLDLTPAIYIFPVYNDITNVLFVTPVTEVSELEGELFICIGLFIWTFCCIDGCKMNQSTSAAYTVFHNETFYYDFKIKLHPFDTAYLAELTVILFALKWFIGTAVNTAIIYSDSLSSILAINNAFPGNKFLLNIYNIIYGNPNKFFKLGRI